MQPSPRAETSRLLFPNLRFCICFSCHSVKNFSGTKLPSQRIEDALIFKGYSDLREAISIEKRYFTSDLSSLS